MTCNSPTPGTVCTKGGFNKNVFTPSAGFLHVHCLPEQQHLTVTVHLLVTPHSQAPRREFFFLFFKPMLEHVGVAGYCTFAFFFNNYFHSVSKENGNCHLGRQKQLQKASDQKIKQNKYRSWVMNLHTATQRGRRFFLSDFFPSDGFGLFSVSHQREGRDVTNPAKGAVMEVHLSAATASPKICRPSGNTWPSDASGPVI